MPHLSPSSPPPPHPFDPAGIADAVARFREPAHVSTTPAAAAGPPAKPLRPPALGTLPGIYPEWLGDPAFVDLHGARFAYVAGEMANGIASVEYVLAAARAGVLGFFGAAGLAPPRVEAAVTRLRAELEGTGLPFGINLIHSPNEPAIEDAVVDLLLRAGVRRVSASAYVALTPAVVRYAASGPRRGPGRARAAAEPRLRQALAPGRGAALHEPGARGDPRRAGDGPADHRGRGAPRRRRCPSPRTSPSSPTPAGTPTTGRSARSSRRSPPRATPSSGRTATRAPSGSAPPAGLGTPEAVAAAFALGRGVRAGGLGEPGQRGGGALARRARRCWRRRAWAT